METKIARELGMERREPEIVRAPEHGHTIELREALDERDVGAEDGECFSVLAKRALEREDPDLHLAASASRGHQPRSASFTSSVSISSPRIASPKPRETLATMSASS